jgi:beta-galactosidase GanA
MPLTTDAARRRRRAAAVLAAGVVVTALTAIAPAAAAPAPATSAPAAAASTAAPAPAPAAVAHSVTWDQYSLLVDGKRTILWSGEFHPFRLPSPSLWADILQKMKGSGYNAVSIYVDWAYESSAPGVYDWTGVRDLDAFLDLAQRVGIYVIARPGPYINAEVDGGGFPGWLTTKTGQARTSAAGYLTYSDEYQSQVDAILARHQLTNGKGPVILYQIENENAAGTTSQAGQDYMAHLYAKARQDGITVPIFHNDKGRNGYWVPGSFTTPTTENPPNYLYGFDGYPAGVCSSSGNPGTPGAPPDWGRFGVGGAKGGATASPTTPGLLAEFGGGWFDPWGDKLMGGGGYSCMRARQSAAMERQYYLTNIANGITIQNVYMTFGGTSWGWLPAPLVYSSYDYGAAIDESRALTSKIAPMKEIGYFLQSVAPITKTVAAGAVTASDPAVKTYHVTNPDTGTHFYFVRSDSTAAKARFTLPITTADGSWTVPASGSIGLDGVDMKVLVADHDLGTSHLVYSTSEIMTEAAGAAAGGADLALLYTRDGQDGETVLRYAAGTAAQPKVDVLAGTAPSTSWDTATGDLRFDYSGSGLTVVRIAGDGTRRPLLLLLAAESVARTFSRLDTPSGPVLVRGPELLRSAAVRAGTLALTGDTTDAAPLEVWAAAGATRVTWNDRPVAAGRQASGALAASTALPGAPAVTLPQLTGWRAMPESPESTAGFDDSGWVAADHTTSASRTPVPAGQPVLFADDYGYHYGDVWYRGHYSGTATPGTAASSGDPSSATSVALTYQTGQVGMLEAWLDGQYLGSHQMATPTAAQSTVQGWTATAMFAVPAGLRTGGDHVLAVLVRPQGHEEDGGSNDAFRNARGLLSVAFSGAAGAVAVPVAWRIQGSQGGETATVPARGPLNNGGLYGERAGWSLPGYPTATWTPVTLPVTDTRPGVTWYRTDVDLHVPQGVDASIGLTIADDPARTYRAVIFVNGWNVGQYVNDVGPQHTFVLPNGVLDPSGHNTIALAVTSRDPGTAAAGGPLDAAGGLGAVSLTLLAASRGGVPVRPDDAPGYAAPRLSPSAPVTAAAGTAWSGTVATVTVPGQAQGTSFAATVDWGDGTTSSAQVTGSGAARAVTGAHVYARAGTFPVTVVLRDAYGPVLATSHGRCSVRPR